jgi:SAM-dependent methyltransferase
MADIERDRLFTGSIPEIYDRYLVPFIFDDFALDLAERVASHHPIRVLEIAAGTGVVSRALAEALPGSAIISTDLNQAMLDYAAKRSDASNLRWQQADALALPFADGQFDSVVCQFGVMFFPDRVAAYREARRVLASGGRFLFNTWDRIEENEIPMAVSDAVASLFPDDPPSFLRRTPHGYYQLDVIRTELADAGFGTVDIETIAKRSRAQSARDPAIAFCQGSPLRNELEQRDARRLGEAIETATSAVAGRYGASNIDGRIQAHVIDARP